MESNVKVSSADLEEIFVDHKDVRFWMKEGQKHNYLFWVRAMISKELPLIKSVQTHYTTSADISVKTRKDIYGLFAKSFDAPNTELVKNLVDGSFCDELQCFNDLKNFGKNSNVVEGKKLILDMKGLDYEETLDILEKEYTNIFFDSYLPFIPPYESIYRGEKHVMGKLARDVESFYKKINLGAHLEMPDHISHECEFVSIICEKELNEAKESEKEAYRMMREEFLRNHLLTWSTMFCCDLGELAKSNFYKGISLIGKEFFDMEFNLYATGVGK